jgi:adenylate kinase
MFEIGDVYYSDFHKWHSWRWENVFCNIVKEQMEIPFFSASELISKARNSAFKKDKTVLDIDENQKYLLAAVNKLREDHPCFILDGHFCLLNELSEVQRVPYDLFLYLKPEAIIVLTEKPDIIVKRRKERDGINILVNSIENFQNEEVLYAKEVSENLEAQLFVSKGKDDLNLAIDFIRNIACL